MNGETYEDEQEYQMQLALSRNERQQRSLSEYLRERSEYLRERVKDELKERAKQEAKKIAARVMKKAAQQVTKVLIRMLMQLIRMVVVFLVATPPGWVIDIVILIIIASIVLATDAGGIRTAIWNTATGPIGTTAACLIPNPITIPIFCGAVGLNLIGDVIGVDLNPLPFP